MDCSPLFIFILYIFYPVLVTTQHETYPVNTSSAHSAVDSRYDVVQQLVPRPYSSRWPGTFCPWLVVPRPQPPAAAIPPLDSLQLSTPDASSGGSHAISAFPWGAALPKHHVLNIHADGSAKWRGRLGQQDGGSSKNLKNRATR